MASGYKLIIGILSIIIVSFLWIPLNYVFGIVVSSLNSMVTDADVIARNNMMGQAFYWTLLIIIIAVIVYIIKPTKKGEEDEDIIYVSPTY